MKIITNNPKKFFSLAMLLMLISLGILGKKLRYYYMPTSNKYVINGTFAINWGQFKSSIKERFGPPDGIIRKGDKTRLGSDETVHIFIYRNNEYLGEKVDRKFFIHPEYGLIKAKYEFYFGPGKDCMRVFRKLKTKIQKQYPKIKPIKNSYKPPDVPFCNALVVDRAGRILQWVDPYSDSMITLSLGVQSRKKINLLFESDRFYDLRSEATLIDYLLWQF